MRLSAWLADAEAAVTDNKDLKTNGNEDKEGGSNR
jgi:hypothetical protein